MPAQNCWIFSLARCGSSVTAYASAAAFNLPVADEPFGPWNRTGAPYHYPAEQNELRERFWNAGEHLTPQIVELAQRVLGAIAADADRLIIKHPHTMIDPDEFHATMPDHREVHLLRNPLLRLNSLYARNWLGSIGEQHDLPRFTLAARRWLDAPTRMIFEDLARDPRAFFAALWDGWGWAYTDAHLDAAIAYQQGHYHDSSAKLSAKNPKRPLSQRRFALPDEAIDLYLGDPFIVELMDSVGWSTNPDDYRTAVSTD